MKLKEMYCIIQTCCLFSFLTFCVGCQNERLFNENFKVIDCNKPEMNVILRVIPKKTTIAYHNIHCALLCQRDRFCKYAIFNARNNLCQQIYGLTNTFRPVDQDYVSNTLSSTTTNMTWTITPSGTNTVTSTGCSVLIRVLTESWTCGEMEDLMYFSNVDEFVEMKLGEVYPPSHQLTLVSLLTVDQSEGFMVATYGKIFLVKLRKGETPIFQPFIKARFMYVYGDSSLQEFHFEIVRVRDAVNIQYTNLNPKIHFTWKHIKLESAVLIADTFEDVKLSLMSGHRRMDPHPTYAVIREGDIQFNVVDKIPKEIAKTGPQSPMYLTSIKEFINSTGSQSTLRLKYIIFDDQELPPEVDTTTSSLPLVMDTTWAKVTSLGGQKNDDIKSSIRQGKAVRIVIDNAEDSISADIVMVRIAGNSVMASLSHVMLPWEVEHSKDINLHSLAFPVFGSAEKTLMFCTTESTSGRDMDMMDPDNFYDVDIEDTWYFSTKPWTSVLVVDSSQRVVFGSSEKLRESVENGKNVRVCVEENSDQFYCLTGPFIGIKLETGETIFESYQFVDPYPVFTEVQGTFVCMQQQVILISSAGWIESITIGIGLEDQPLRKLGFEQIFWFVELM